MLSDSVAQAEAHWLFEPSRERVVKRLASMRTPWSGICLVRVTERFLEFDGIRSRQTSLSTVVGAEQAGPYVWVQRRHAHDWLVECPTEADARTLTTALLAR